MIGLANFVTLVSSLLGDPDRIPNEEAIALSPTVGWLMLLCVVAVIVMFIVQSDRWRRFWLVAGDPRPMALFRIVFAFLVICNVNDVWEYFRFLFTDEGIFMTDVGRQVFASHQFAGFGDGFGDEPYGFFSAAAIYQFFLGPKYSLLFFWDSPQAFAIHQWVFYLFTALFMIGWRTRTTGVISLLLFNSIVLRNHLFWEGTELVYRVFFFYLIVSRCGHAYSVDNWLRCRKLRKQGLLSEPGGPGDGAGLAPCEAHPKGLQAIYRRVPIWSRRLMMLNLAALYCYTGVVKNGSVWARGDALYYALNMDHFYRFYPQELSSIVGTTLFRLATWVTHWWEACFPLLVVGVVTRWAFREQLKPLSGRTLRIVQFCWLLFAMGCMAVAVVALPVHLPRIPRYPLPEMQFLFAGLWIVLCILLGLMWRLLRGPLTIKLGGKTKTLRFPGWLDREWFCTWVLGRRTWLTLGILFHGNLHLLMNIGMFPPIMIATYCCYLHGDEPGKILRWFGRRMPRWVPGIPESVRRGDPPIPLEDPALPHHFRDNRKYPRHVLWATLGATFVGVLFHYFDVQHFGWSAMAIAFGLTGYAYVQAHRGTPRFRTNCLTVAAMMLGYTWLLHQYDDQPDGPWMWIKLYVHLGIAAIVILKLIPVTSRWLAKFGLTFRPKNGPADPELPLNDPHSGLPRDPWAYGPFGRMFVGALIVWHIVGVAAWLMPEKDTLSAFRVPTRDIWRRYLITTQTDQSWGMFAPNPPRHNVFMQAMVIDQNDEVWDLRTDVYAPERKPIPWIWNDRMRKMNRRIIGGESGKGDWYQKWYSRWLCREWALAHRGTPPKKIELYKISYRMPTPQQVATRGWYKPEELMLLRGRRSRKHVETCKSGINAQLPNFIRERYGLPQIDNKKVKMWNKKRLEKWEKRGDPETTAIVKGRKRFEKKLKTEQRKLKRQNRSTSKTKSKTKAKAQRAQ